MFLVSVLASQSQQLTATELSLGPAAVIAHQTFAGAELGLARRPNGDSRVALALAGGTLDGRPAARAQLTLQLLMNSAARKGPGYATLHRRDSSLFSWDAKSHRDGGAALM